MSVLDRRRPKATWIRGSARRYESLWLLMHKFVILNRPTLTDIGEIFSRRQQHDSTFSGSFAQGKSISLFSPTFSHRRLALMLGEPGARFRYCTAEPFSKAVTLLFDAEMRFCPLCLQAGYHTVLFAARGMHHCPVHGCELCERCEHCDAPLPATISNAFLDKPGECECGDVFLPRNFQTRPRLSNKELRIFDPLVTWLRACSDRLTTSLEDKNTTCNQWLDDLAPHMQHWPMLLGISPPEYLCFPAATKAGAVLYKHKATKATKPHPCFFEVQRPDTLIYKSIRRYLTKTVLHNRTGPCFGLASVCKDSDMALDCDCFRNKETMHALIFLVWRQRIEGWWTLDRWTGPWIKRWWSWLTAPQILRDLRKYELIGLNRAFSSAVYGPRTSESESDWIEKRFLAQGILALWQRTANEIMRCAAKNQPYRLSRRSIILPSSTCSCVRMKDSTLALSLPPIFKEQRSVLTVTGTGKDERIRAEEVKRRGRWQLLKSKLKASPFVLEWSPIQGWSTLKTQLPKGRPPPTDTRRRRLLIQDHNVHFILYSEMKSGYVARSIEFPIQTTGSSPRDAIRFLKSTVSAYLKRHSL